LADAHSSIAVGDVIRITENNPSGSLTIFTPRELTVVGLTRSASYISTARGNSSIGNGQISNFLYLPGEAFDSEYYTEVLVRVKGTEGLSAFSREYEAAIEEAAAELEKFAELRAEMRYDEIVAEASDEIAKAEEEYEEERGRVEDDLSAAKESLESSKTSLADGWEEYEKARASLERAREELDASRAKLRVSRYELDVLRAALETGKFNLARNKSDLAEYQWRRDSLRAAQAAESDPAAIASIQMQINLIEAQITPLVAQIPRAEVELAATEQQLAAGESAYAIAEREFAAIEKEFADAEKALFSLFDKLQGATSEINEGNKQYEEKSQEATDALHDARGELIEARNELSRLEQPRWIIQNRDDFPGYAGFDADKNRIARLALVLPWFFFLVATIVCLTTMTRLVEEHRSQIGILKACGYRRGQIAAIYQSYAWIIGLTGGALGVACGISLFPSVIWEAYSTMYHMGDFRPIIAPIPCIIGVLGGAIALSLATAFACQNTLDNAAAELLRPRSPKSGKRVLLERAKRLWRKLPFRIKVTARNLSRYRVRLIVTVIGVAGCTALLLAGLGLRDSISSMLDLQYDEQRVEQWEEWRDSQRDSQRSGVSHLRATLILDKASTSTQDTELNRALADYPHAYYHAEPIDASFDGQSSGDVITYLAVPEDPATFTEFITFRKRTNHARIEFPPNETAGPAVIITEQLASTLGIRVGNTISFGAPMEPPVQAKVAGITENYVYNYIYLTPATYRTLFNEEPRFGSIHLGSELEEPEFEKLLEELVAMDNVATALPVAQLQGVMDQVIANMNSVVTLMILAAFILAVVVLYNLITITVLERERELALMKVLGYYPSQVAAFISRETTIMSVIGVIIGIFLGLWLHGYVMQTIEVDEIMFSRMILPLSFVLASLFPLLCNFLVNLSVRPRLNAIDMVKSLKSFE
jgi:putative ABC transport system permease protein